MPVQSGTQYATTTDLANLGLIGGALQNVTTQVQNAALLAASAVADSYLQSRYDLPIANWGQDLVRVVCAIAAYDILTSRGYSPQSQDDHIRQRQQDGIAWLKEVSQGLQTPAYLVDVTSNTGTASSVTTSDDSVVTTTSGGLQMVTSNVRGWTDRGTNGVGSWDNGFNNP